MILITYILALFFLLDAHPLSGYNIAVQVRRPYWFGEAEFACRVQIACANIGWHADIVDFQDESIDQKEYDFVLCLMPNAYKSAKFKSYLTLFDPIHHFFNGAGYLKRPYNSYDGYLITYPMEKDKKEFADPNRYPYMYWVPTVHQVPYNSIDPENLFYICSNWGSRYKNTNYKDLLNLLAQTSYSRIYGPRKLYEKRFKQNFLGELPIDGMSLLSAISAAGICLVLHSDTHLSLGLPSGRIFEAAAASSVIISDKNPFVMKHFGDSVLYIDVMQSGKNIFQDIDQLINWIHENKDEALEMAKRAHRIFETQFSLEAQLLKLGEFHEQLLPAPPQKR